MRKTISIVSASAIAMLALCGCQTPQPGGPSQTALDIGIGIQAVVPIAVAYQCQRQPESVPYFTAAAAAIDAASAGGNYSAAALMEALNGIPNSDKPEWLLAKSAVVAGVNLYVGLANAGKFTPVDAQYDLGLLSAAIRSGLPPATVDSVEAATAPARKQYGAILRRSK